LLLVAKVFAAASYTITYKDQNGKAISTQTAEEGAQVSLTNYPAGAIAWVDTADPDAKSVNSAAKGMAYVNYSANDPNNSAPEPSNMKLTMPSRNITLTAFYGNYQNGNEPRLIQYHLELKYHDANSGCDLAFTQQYRNVNAPSGYVVNLPDENYFAPISVVASNCTDSSRNGTYSSGLVVDKWVNDASYTGTTSPPSDKLFDPTAKIFVDPNNYNQIYDVMVDQTLDWETGVEIEPPTIIDRQPPTIVNPPVNPLPEFTVTFNIGQTYDAAGNPIATPDGAGFTYTDIDGNSHEILANGSPNFVDYTAIENETWGNLLGYPTGTPPVHNDVAGYGTFYWTQDNGTDPVNLGIDPSTKINSDTDIVLLCIM
jgi:hypothetical protein